MGDVESFPSWSIAAVNLPEHADNPVHTADGGGVRRSGGGHDRVRLPDPSSTVTVTGWWSVKGWIQLGMFSVGANVDAATTSGKTGSHPADSIASGSRTLSASRV